MDSNTLSSGKGDRDEEFPVASFLVKAEHRGLIKAFYTFARASDDIADHPTAAPEQKLALPAAMRAGLDGEGAPEAMALREAMATRGIDPVHAHDLLGAFTRDVTVNRYQTWDDLHRLLPRLGHARRPLRARCPRREPRYMAWQRCAVRGLAGDQPPAGLRQGLPRSLAASTFLSKQVSM
jgi:hypothetical protein